MSRKSTVSPPPNPAELTGTVSRRYLMAALVAWLLCSALLFDPKPDTGGDNAVYLALAEAIATGQGFRDIHIVGSPAHLQYPVGFPVLLALLRLVVGSTSVLAAKLLVWLSSLGVVWFGWLILKRLFRRRAGPVLLVLVSLPLLVRAGHQVLTEMPFLCASLAALHFALRAEDEHPRWYLPAVLLAVGALLLRTAGIGLVAGLGLGLLVRRRWSWLALLAVLAAAVIVPGQVRAAAAGQNGTYLDLFLARHPYIAEYGRMGPLDLAARAWDNFTVYAFTVVPEALVPLLEDLRRPVVTTAIGVLLAVLMLLGLWTRLRRRTALEGYALAGGLLLLAWPQLWAGDRFLVPLLPLLVVYLFFGLDWLGGRLKWRRLALAGTAGLVVLNAGAVAVRAARTVPDNLRWLRGDVYAGYSQDWRRYFEVLDWVRENVAPDKVVLARKPEFVWLWTGRQSLCYPFTDDRARVRAAVNRADFILFDNFQWTRTTRDFLNPVLQEDPSRYPVVLETEPPQFYLLSAEHGQ